jgi:hypothetical protein
MACTLALCSGVRSKRIMISLQLPVCLMDKSVILMNLSMCLISLSVFLMNLSMCLISLSVFLMNLSICLLDVPILQVPMEEIRKNGQDL